MGFTPSTPFLDLTLRSPERSSFPILGNADAADTLLLTEWLEKLRKVTDHVASLELAHARPTLLPSMGGSRKSPIRRQRTLALLNNRAEVVAHRLVTLDSSSALWGTRVREIREACSHLPRVGAQVGNPLQCYSSAEEGTPALRAALAVVEHNRPGFKSHRQHPHWPRLTAPWSPFAGQPCEKAKVGRKRMTGQSKK